MTTTITLDSFTVQAGHRGATVNARRNDRYSDEFEIADYGWMLTPHGIDPDRLLNLTRPAELPFDLVLHIRVPARFPGAQDEAYKQAKLAAGRLAAMVEENRQTVAAADEQLITAYAALRDADAQRYAEANSAAVA